MPSIMLGVGGEACLQGAIQWGRKRENRNFSNSHYSIPLQTAQGAMIEEQKRQRYYKGEHRKASLKK